MLIPIVIQSNGNNMVVFDAAINQVVTEQLKEEIRLVAPSHARNDFYKPVFLCCMSLFK